MSSQPDPCRFARGQTVRIGTDIRAVVEEIIWSREMQWPFYLVEWWHEGQLITRRFHQDDLQPWEGRQ